MNVYDALPGEHVGDTIYRRASNGAWWWARVVWRSGDLLTVDGWQR